MKYQKGSLMLNSVVLSINSNSQNGEIGVDVIKIWLHRKDGHTPSPEKQGAVKKGNKNTGNKEKLI